MRTHNTGGNSLGLGQCVAPRVSELQRCRGEKRPMITRRAVKEWRERLRHGKAAWGPNKGTGGMARRRAQYNPPAYLSRFPAPITTLTRRGWTRPQFRRLGQKGRNDRQAGLFTECQLCCLVFCLRYSGTLFFWASLRFS